MTKDKIQKSLEEAKKQILELQDHIQNLERKLDECDDGEIPEYPRFEADEEFWYMDGDLDVNDSCTWDSDITSYNIFRTKEMAQLFSDKCKLIAMMLHCKHYLDDNGKTSFDGTQNNYTVWYNHYSDEWQLDWNVSYESTSVYFSTKEAAQKCADWLNARMERDKND